MSRQPKDEFDNEEIKNVLRIIEHATQQNNHKYLY
jgi:hypothetical protein